MNTVLVYFVSGALLFCGLADSRLGVTEAWAQEAVSVSADTPSAVFSLTPSPVLLGNAVSITWECKNASSAYIQPGIGPVSLNGVISFAPSKSTDFTLSCSGSVGTVTALSTVVVILPPKPACTITANPVLVTDGQSSLVEWECINVSSVIIQPDLGDVAFKGAKNIIPTKTTTYTITGTGSNSSVHNSATVQIAPFSRKNGSINLNVQFDTGKADIKAKFHTEIGRIAAFLRQNPGVAVTIEGYTDAVGDENSNIRLSQRRADVIRNYLINKFNISRTRVSAVGYGSAQPIADNSTAEGRQKNRRTVTTFKDIVQKDK